MHKVTVQVKLHKELKIKQLWKQSEVPITSVSVKGSYFQKNE